MKDIHERIKHLMDVKGLNNAQFAKLLEVHPSVTHNITKGKKNSPKTEPSFSVLRKILSFYNDINANWLVCGEGEMLKENSKELEVKTVQIRNLEEQIQELKDDKKNLIELLKMYAPKRSQNPDD